MQLCCVGLARRILQQNLSPWGHMIPCVTGNARNISCQLFCSWDGTQKGESTWCLLPRRESALPCAEKSEQIPMLMRCLWGHKPHLEQASQEQVTSVREQQVRRTCGRLVRVPHSVGLCAALGSGTRCWGWRGLKNVYVVCTTTVFRLPAKQYTCGKLHRG